METTANKLNKMNQRLLFIVMSLSFLLILLSAVAGYAIGKREAAAKPTPYPAKPVVSVSPTGAVACTMDAKICPDGSSVGRVPPKCDFAPCPVVPTKAPTASPTSPPASSSQTIDFGACRSGDGYAKAIPGGSTSLLVLRKERSYCVTRISNETGNSISVSQCNVPKDVGTISFSISDSGSDFSPIQKYCNINTRTNVNTGN